jgi:hypothetical protein
MLSSMQSLLGIATPLRKKHMHPCILVPLSRYWGYRVTVLAIKGLLYGSKKVLDETL